MNGGGDAIANAHSSAFKESEDLEGKCSEISGYNFNESLDYSRLMSSMLNTGFQATHLGEAINIVNQMLDWSLLEEAVSKDCSEEESNLKYRELVNCKVFLGFTSNLVSSGLRDTFRYLVEHRMVDVVVTTAGGVEEDLIKCLAPTYRGDFSLAGEYLRSKGLNRIGNLLVPNGNYCKFEDWIIPIFNQMLKEQVEQNVLWTPSKLIARLGKEINDERSYLYWAYKNNIPVYCPSITDGSLGDMLYFHSVHSPGLIVDVVQDIRAMNGEAVHSGSRKTGMIILGGGLPKHHICNANMMRNGADYAVFINTAQEYDGSDSGARPDEAVSWGKLRASAKTVKVHCDATIAFPLLVAETFAKRRIQTNCAAMAELTPARKKGVSQNLNCEAMNGGGDAIANAHSSAFKESEDLEGKCSEISGYNFNESLDYSRLMSSMLNTGFQATHLGEAINIVNQMLDWSLLEEAVSKDCSEEESNLKYRELVNCKVFLGFTSNLVSSGLRDTFRYLVEHRMVDVVVTTAGGVEEDLIKCLAPTYRGDFSLAGEYLRSKGLNRIGNLLVPNGNYCKFEDWIIPIFNQMLKEQVEQNVLWTPSKLIARLGKEINDERSYLYWAYKNNIPVYCPSITDGSLGDMLYFHSVHSPGLIVDVVQDIRAMNGEAVHSGSRKTGMIILGGGLPKHHICNANMMRNGADYAVFINTAQEYDGSDSGARPDEAVSWGKLRASAKTVKVHCDATIAFPLLVAETFAKRRIKNSKQPLNHDKATT